MERPGEKLKRVREQLNLTYRDVFEASQIVARRRGSEEYAIALSRLADIENKGTVPTIYRLYTLCAVYRLDFAEVLHWYGVPLDLLPVEALELGLDETHPVRFAPHGTVTVPLPLDQEIDLDKTTFLSHMLRRWGKMPLSLLQGLDVRHLRYGLIGLADWSMYPLLQPGSLVVIDQNLRKIAKEGWTNEYDRPIYFLERRGGYLCGWCSIAGDHLVLQPHPASQQPPTLLAFREIDIVGQVTGVAMLLESRRPRRARTSATPAESPNP
ncbi:MAG TPA: helix-turn-helix transcriptional regulator [Bryobacteraceae bacterium]|nr:helix-turn-helix transcriptional regulator [Bryobacteraceae bacterium]